MPGETKEACLDAFVAARQRFEKLMGELRSESARSREDGDAEYMALHHCREGQRNYVSAPQKEDIELAA